MASHINEPASFDLINAVPVRTTGRSLWIVLSVALALRVAWAIAVPVVPMSDCIAYDTFARNLAAGHGYCWKPDEGGTAYWPVGTSLAYSIVYRLFGVHYGPVVVLNILVGMAVVWLTTLLATKWFGAKSGLPAGMLLALWPSQIEFTTVMASEVFFMACICGALFAWYGRIRLIGCRVLVTAVLLAMAAYLRPTALLLPVVLGASEVARNGRLLHTAMMVVAILAVIAVCVAPWSMRNTRLFGQLVLISTNGGANTWMGNNPQTDGGYQPLPSMPGMNEAQRDQILGQQALRYIAAEPVRFAIRSGLKFLRLHERETIGVVWNKDGLRQRYHVTEQAIPMNLLKAFSTVFWWAALALALGGVASLAYRTGLWRTITHPACLIWIYFSTVHAITVIQDRYHFASIPLISALAGSYIPVLRESLAKARLGRTLPT